MRIRIDIDQVTPAQWRWLLDNVRQEYRFEAKAIRMCVTFTAAAGGEHLHREIEVKEWVRIVEELKRVSFLAEAALTPDALPDAGPRVMWGAYPRNAYERIRDGYSGYSGL